MKTWKIGLHGRSYSVEEQTSCRNEVLTVLAQDQTVLNVGTGWNETSLGSGNIVTDLWSDAPIPGG